MRAGVRTAFGGAGTPAPSTAAGESIAVAEASTAVFEANTAVAEANTVVVEANTVVDEASTAAGANNSAEIRMPKKIWIFDTFSKEIK